MKDSGLTIRVCLMGGAVLVLILFLPVACFGQWYVGGKAGVAFSNYKTKTPWREVSNMGFSAGIAAYKQLRTHVGFSMDLHYIQKGYYHKICNAVSDQLVANYVEAPVSVDYNFMIPYLKNFKAHLLVGFYTAFWLSGKYKMNGFDSSSEDFDFSENNTRRFDFGPNAGGRLEYVLKNGSVSLEARYEMGLVDLQKTLNDNTNNTNRALIISLSYTRPLESR